MCRVAIPFDNVDDEQIQKPQRWNPADLGRFMVFFGPISSIFDILTFCLMWWVFHANTPETQTLFQSGWFVVGLLSQTLIVHMIRTRRVPFIQSCASWPLMIDRDRDDCRDRIAVFTAGQLSATAGAAVKLFPVAGCDSGRVYDVNPVGERFL